ncbi:NB-ARC domain-containing protein [Streptomyces sp. NBC_01715]|uniref:NB-ARC domain-containing protein n=1 Tax=Streptomyces sp. NBC_01715 TaxID=2975916 RepID=UPI002E3536D8|nr:NB-ARC domain-containing protein [Streptomyces sp. NBC_01715]
MNKSEFLPVSRMLERANLAREESDTAYFFDLLYLGEMLIKVLVVELLAALQADREQHRYAAISELVRADSIGRWAELLDQLASGPASQHLVAAGQDSQRAITIAFGPGSDSWQRKAVDALNSVCNCLDSNYEDMSGKKVSFRRWAHDFSWLRNRTRGHGAPRGATLSVICPQLADSLTEVINNAPAFSRSWVHLQRNLSGKYRVSPFGDGHQGFLHLARESEHNLPDGTYVDLEGPRTCELLFTDPDLTDFFMPNGNFRNGKYETLSYISDERRSGDGTPYLLPVEAQPRSETAAQPDMAYVGNLFSNMPPLPEHYVQRAELERQLTERLCDDRYPVITLQGRGGVGKTSLALEVLHKVARMDEFFGIVWFSARDIDLLPEGPKVVRPDVLSTDDIALDFSQLMAHPSARKSKESRKYLADCLSGNASEGPFIFVFDNFETVREQAELYQFVSNSVRLPNKVLITTRTREFKADYPIEVGGMRRGEYSELVATIAGRLGIASLLDPEYEESLFRESDGHPYITKVLLGEIAEAGRRVTVKRVVAARDAMLDALFERSFASLSSTAQRVFLTLCGWRSLVPRLGLEAVLLRPENDRLDVEGAVAELEQRSLIEVMSRQGTSGEEFLSVPLAASLFGKKKLVTSPMRIAVNSDLKLMQEFGPTTDASHGLASRIERLARFAARQMEIGKDISQELSVIEYMATGYPSAWLTLAEFQRNQMSDNVAAIRAVNRYLENCPDDQYGWGLLITLYRATEEPLAEMNARLRLAELTEPPFHDLSSAASRLNGLLHRKELALDADERRHIIRRLRGLLEARHIEGDATDLSRLAWLCMYDEQDTAAADRWVTEGLHREPSNEHCLRLKRRLVANSSDSA